MRTEPDWTPRRLYRSNPFSPTLNAPSPLVINAPYIQESLYIGAIFSIRGLRVFSIRGRDYLDSCFHIAPLPCQVCWMHLSLAWLQCQNSLKSMNRTKKCARSLATWPSEVKSGGSRYNTIIELWLESQICCDFVDLLPYGY